MKQSRPVLSPLRAEPVSGAISEVARSVRDAYPQGRGLVLTGSAARNEATIVELDGVTHWLSDLELLVVLDNSARVAGEVKELDRLSQQIARKLASEGIRVVVELTPAPERYFSSIRPHLFGYELRECGRQLFGAEDYLARIPEFHWSEIPKEDAWRLLSNRMVEWLDYLLAPQGMPLPQQFYVLAKQYLDLATSLSLFSGHYARGYRARATALDGITAWIAQSGVPVDPHRFAESVRIATDFKFDPSCAFAWLWNSQDTDLPRALSGQGLGWLHDSLPDTLTSLWRWQAAQVAGSDPSRIYGQRDRARGWGKLLISIGTGSRLGAVLRMLRLFHAGTPRSLVYESAARLLASRDPQTLNLVRQRLPVLAGECGGSWEYLAGQCVLIWNQSMRRGRA